MIADFLRAVWGPSPLGRFGEIRTIEPAQTQPKEAGPFMRPVILQTFVPLDGPDWWEFAADAVTHKFYPGRDIYFGVLPRLRKSGTNGDVGDEVQALWADVDAKKVSDVLDIGKFSALTAINGFVIPPQILVDSGGGWHAYWLLEKPVPYELAVPVMRWIASALNGDAVHDKARVLRVPGTNNYKRQPVTPARLVRFDLSRAYRFADFEGIMPIPREPRRLSTGPRPRIDVLPDWLQDLIVVGAPKGQRSETCYRAILWLMRYGRTQGEIREIFEATPDGIGAKYAEKSRWDADRWLDITIKAAESQV